METYKVTFKSKLINPIFVYGGYVWNEIVKIDNKRKIVLYDTVNDKFIYRTIYDCNKNPCILLDNKRIMLNQFECYHNGVIYLGSELQPE